MSIEVRFLPIKIKLIASTVLVDELSSLLASIPFGLKMIRSTPKPKSSKAAALGLKDHIEDPNKNELTEIKLEGNKAN